MADEKRKQDAEQRQQVVTAQANLVWASSKGYHLGMAWSERITVDPHILAGKPVIRGTRLSVEFVLSLLAAGQPEEQLLRNYPGVAREDILACLSYASYLAHQYKAYPIPA